MIQGGERRGNALQYPVLDKTGHQIGLVYEAAGNPASAANQLAKIIIEKKGQVDEAAVQKFKQLYLAAISAYSGDTRLRLTHCEETGAISLACKPLFERWACLRPEKRPQEFPDDITIDLITLR